MSGVLNYPAYFWITQAFESTTGSISNLANGINTMKSTCKDVTLLGSFLENHDNVRFPSLTSDVALAKNAILFTMLMDGIPIIYYGQEQHFSGASTPSNREALWTSDYSTTTTLYEFITKINAIRTFAINKASSFLTYNAYPIYSDTHNIAMRKGVTGSQLISAYSNVGASASASFTLSSADTGFTANEAITELISCTAVTADASGDLDVTVFSGVPGVFTPTAALSGSSLCSSSTKMVKFFAA